MASDSLAQLCPAYPQRIARYSQTRVTAGLEQSRVAWNFEDPFPTSVLLIPLSRPHELPQLLVVPYHEQQECADGLRRSQLFVDGDPQCAHDPFNAENNERAVHARCEDSRSDAEEQN